MKKKVFTAVLALLIAAVFLPQAALGASASKQKAPAVTETLRGFSAYTATADCISLHWYALDQAEGVLIYRASSAKGTFKQIAKVKQSSEAGTEYEDKTVKPGKTYYYKARPYMTYKGKIIKGKLTGISKKKAAYYRPTTAAVTVTQTGEKEILFQITMDAPGFDAEFFCEGEGKYEELGTLELMQSWISGKALEQRRTELKVTGLGTDGMTYAESGSIKVAPGGTVYLKAAAGEVLTLGTESRLEWNLPCLYDGKYGNVSFDNNQQI